MVFGDNVGKCGFRNKDTLSDRCDIQSPYAETTLRVGVFQNDLLYSPGGSWGLSAETPS